MLSHCSLAVGGARDLVWTTPNTFVASANCAKYCGADVDFVDVDVLTSNMSVIALEAKLLQAASTGRLPRVVIPVHFAGHPCDMESIARLSAKYGFRVIEDASHAVGASLGEGKVGDCRFSDATVFSFHPVKIITTGEGGAITTRSAELAARLRLLRTHGITREPSELDDSSQGAWYYEQQLLGFNYRMTDIQAALGFSQLRHLRKWVEERNRIALRYDRLLAGLPLRLPPRPVHSQSSFHLYVVHLEAAARQSRKSVFDSMRAAGVL